MSMPARLSGAKQRSWLRWLVGVTMLALFVPLVPAVPAGAGPVASPRVVSWSVSPTSLPSTGGNISISATVTYSSTCTFSSNRATIGLPVTVPCSSGSASVVVTAPANTVTTRTTFAVYLTATGPTGLTAVPGPINVNLDPLPLPSVSGLNVVPNTMPYSGGLVTISAPTITAAVTCTFSSNYPVAGLPITVPCSSGSASVSVVLPANPALLPKFYSFYLHPNGNGPPRPSFPPVVAEVNSPKVGGGYWEVAADGGLFSYGAAQFYGSMGGKPLNKPIVAMASTPDGGGYWMVASDGGIFSFGDAQYFGSMGGQPLNQPIIGMAPTPDGQGYWLVALDGGVFTFGDAIYYGSTGGQALASLVVGMAVDPMTGGYWTVQANGAVLGFNAPSFGPTGGLSGIVALEPTPDGGGLWLIGASGGVFSYGDAGFFGSNGGDPTTSSYIGAVGSLTGNGYTLAVADGEAYSFGDAPFFGPNGPLTLNAPMVGIAAPGAA